MAVFFQDKTLIDLCNSVLPGLVMIVCFVSAYRRITNSTMFLWSPETWFLLYSGLQFGLGSLVYFSGNEDLLYNLDFAMKVRGADLLKTNLLNSITITLVLLGTKFLPHTSSYTRKGVDLRHAKMLSLFFFIVFLLLAMLSKVAGLLPSAILDLGKNGIIACLVINFFLWSRGERKQAGWALLTLALLTLISLPDFGKTVFIQNFLFAGLGYLLARPVLPKKQFIVFASLLMLLLVWYRPISEYGRRQGLFLLSYEERLDATVSYIFTEKREDPSRSERQESILKLWSRQSLNSVQAFLIDQYDRGQAGDTISNSWIYFIPRLFWPDKPITTDVARKLNKLVYGHTGSSLAPSFNGDAYWNGGWLAVIFISLYVGVIIGFLSRLSLKYLFAFDFRILPIAIAGINLGRYVEGFFANAFIGGVIIMGCSWFLLKRILPPPKTGNVSRLT